MKSKELREWYQSGISLYDIEILMMYDLNDSDLRGYFTLIRDNGVSVNDIDYILRHNEIGAAFQKQLLQALSTDKKQFEASLCWLEEKGILDTSKDCREDTPEEEEEIDRICEIVDEIIDSYDNYQVDFEKQYTTTAFLIRLLCYNQGKELIPTLPLNGEKIINFPDYYGYFGAGNNVNWTWLKNNGCWSGTHPMNFRYTREQFDKIMQRGNVDVQNVIIN